MANISDLLDPLRYESLGDYTLANLKTIGDGVFTELNTLDHLALLDQIVKAYQAVHLPTNGAICIPQSTDINITLISDSQDQANLLTAKKNEVLEIVSIFVDSPSNYGVSTGYLAINNYPVVDLVDLDSATNSFSGLIYGNAYDQTNSFKSIITPSPLYLNGGDVLTLYLKNTPSSNMSTTVLYRKMVQ